MIANIDSPNVNNCSRLTATEIKRREELEDIVDRNLDVWREVSAALVEIHENKLWRDEAKTFKEYCDHRWEGGLRWAYMVMSSGKAAKDVNEPIARESVARELVDVPPAQRQTVYTEAKNESNGKPPTAKAVRKARAKIIPDEPVDVESRTPSPDDVLDALHRPVPVSLRPAFENRDRFRQVRSDLKSIRTNTNEMLGKLEKGILPLPGCEYLTHNRQQLNAAIDSILGFINYADPHSPCPVKHKGDQQDPACRCRYCRGNGYLIEDGYKKLPAEMKQ